MVLNFFRNAIVDDPLFFDEGSSIRITSATTLTSSIDTIDVDAYKQGIEITSQRAYIAGFVKIYSGEAGHAMSRSDVGSDNDFTNDITFREPVTVAETTIDRNLTLNGMMEPFIIRDLITLKRHVRDVPNLIRCNLQQGNEDSNGGDQVVTEFARNVDYVTPTFIDGFRLNFYGNNIVNSFDMNGVHVEPNPSIERPFDDRRIQTIVGLTDQNFLTYISSSRNEIMNEMHACAGWTFDGVRGTDSIAFGGLSKS